MNEAPGQGSKQTEFCHEDNLMERRDIVVPSCVILVCRFYVEGATALPPSFDSTWT